MSGNNKKSVDSFSLIIGLIMVAVGLYWFMSSIVVTSGFYGMRLLGFSVGSGLVIVPFVAGIFWMFYDHKSIFAKVLTALGFVVILASVIMNTRIYMRPVSLYSYIIMVVMTVGGAAFIAKAFFKR